MVGFPVVQLLFQGLMHGQSHCLFPSDDDFVQNNECQEAFTKMSIHNPQ